mmetsp:Transcript_25460/g.40827  ORF Transcript_25460/g.40827 Transcript_25460/m.40827 type:complete len:319 (-) Transcript_25460:423-1379(-)
MLQMKPPKEIISILPQKCKRTTSFLFLVNNIIWAGHKSLDKALVDTSLSPLDDCTEDTKFDGWSQTSVFLDSFSAKVAPHGYGRSLNLAMLLSVLSGTQISKDSTLTNDQLHLLVSSNDVIVQRMMTYATTFYKRCIIYNEIPSQKEWIKMNGGLIFFRLQATPKKNTVLLEKIIKERTSTVWVLVPSSIRNMKKDYNKLAYQFDLVVNIDPIYDSKMDTMLSSFILDGYRSSTAGFSVESLSQRRSLEVHMTRHAQELIKDYFMAARARRNSYTFHELETIARVSRRVRCHHGGGRDYGEETKEVPHGICGFRKRKS